MGRRRAISEILSVIILIAVVVAGSAIFVGLSQERILADTISISEALDRTNAQSSELLKKIHMTKTTTNSTIILQNYGFVNVEISQIFLDNEKNPTSDYKIFSLDKTFEYEDNTISFQSPNSTVNLFINQTYNDRVILVTSNQNIFELLF